MGGERGEDIDFSREVQLDMGVGAVAESLSIYLPDFEDKRGFFAHFHSKCHFKT